jgi:regulator of protease activity HflC (stomatin/prohibitin superfamily)
MQDLNQQVIKHGTITRFRVLKGEIGLAWENSQPSFFDEGVYEKDSPNFVFEKCVNASDKQISLGSRKIITVWDGEVGVSFKRGKLVVLTPDRHNIDSVEHTFQGFLSTQQQCLHLAHTDGGGPIHKDKDPNLLYCETKDFVEIGLKADVFYKIIEAEKVLLVVGKDSVIPLVRETSIATLNSIIRSTSLAEVAQNKDVAAKSEKQALRDLPPGAPSAPLFFDKVHDEFIAKLHDTFCEKFGIEITNIRIESFKISNKELSDNISKQALATAQTENQLANLAGQTEIATAQMKRDAEVARIKAEGDAIRLKTETDAKNRATMEIAKAEADSAVIRARAEAQSVELRAEAEAKAILLRADAEAKKAEMLQKNPLGGQLAMFAMYSEMVRGSMQGVEKVMYLPTESLNNPMSFFTLTNGQLPGSNFFKPETKSMKEMPK